MTCNYQFALLILAALFAFPLVGRADTVRGWEGTIELPTYLLGDEDPSPPFQLSNRHDVYPYTMLDDLTDRRELKTYHAIFLENEFLKATILPDLGGRVYSLFDKTAQREVFYRNHVVKYGLVALRGAWISGGIEFNFPNGHTMVTVSPVDARLLQTEDGSAKAVVGGIDLVTEMHWEVALTLPPGRARLEQHVTLFNSSPLPQLYWYWANAGVPATNDMQFIYPMREANPHSHTEIWSYPVWKGVDYSWYKNIPQPTSLFGSKIHRKFFAAYYHNSDYGVVHSADFHEVPGKKIWSWGTAPDGLIWTDLLTDADGPYNEIQSGRYETQLSQEFLSPRRVESWTEYWYPVRGLGGGLVEATNDLALNVKYMTNPPRAELALEPVVDVHGAKLQVRLGTRLLREFDLRDIKAGSTARFTQPLDDLDAAKKELEVQVSSEVRPHTVAGSEDSRILLSWSATDPVDGNPDFVPAAGVHRLKQPGADSDVDELFLRGVREQKEGQQETAARTYQQVLDRDPGHVGVLLKLAWHDYRAANLQGGESRIARALQRDNTDPKIHYAAGVIYRAAGRWTLAEDAFWSSIQFGGPQGPPLTQLGEIGIHEKRYAEATRLLRQALRYNQDDALALTDLAVALRLSGMADEARRTIDRALVVMPLLPYALMEERRIKDASQSTKPSNVVETGGALPGLHPNDEPYLSVAAWYRELNDLDSSNATLELAVHLFPDSPLLYGYLASNSWKHGLKEQASGFAAKAAAAPYAKVFPHRISDAAVLSDLVAHNPRDAHAYFLLGNFLFARGRHAEAADTWLRALGLGFDDSVLERNLGFWVWRIRGDRAAAASYYEKAIRLAPRQYRLYADLDQIYFELGDKVRRQRLYTAAPQDVVARDTVRVRHALMLVELHRFDQALALLQNHRFKPWEGAQSAREAYVLANMEHGRQALQAKKYKEAERSFRAAAEYPTNLGVGKPADPPDKEANYWLAEALSAQGRQNDAATVWRRVAKEEETAKGTASLFRAAALRRLENTGESEKIFHDLIEAARKEGATSDDLCVAGLAERFSGHESLAEDNFRQSSKRDPGNVCARIELERTAATSP